MAGHHDFDFFVGTWRVHHRRLVKRLTGCTRWETFEGSCTTRTMLGGAGNIDDNILEAPAGTYRAATVRTFDPGTGDWSIWWFDGRTPHQLEPSVVGRFRDGIGTFYADDTLRGLPIRVRFVWSEITASTCRWEQAFSPDGGATWEPNWVMQFERLTP
jgi:hypothetical protein